MTDSKLFHLLNNLTPGEFKELEKFISSAYFNKGRDMIPFFKTIKAFYPDFSNKNLNNEFIFRKLFPGKKYSEIKSGNLIRTLSSHLFKICKDFLIQTELNENIKLKDYMLLSQFRKRKLYGEFDRVHDASMKTIDKIHKGNIRDFTERYLLASSKTECELDKDNFPGAFYSTILEREYSLAAALAGCFKHEDHKNISVAFKLDIPHNLMDSLMENLDADNLMKTMKENNERFYPQMQIYYLVYKMNRDKSKVEYYYELKKLLSSCSDLFGQSENYVLWNTMHTYCEFNNLGKEETFSIYEHIVKHNIYRKSDREDFHIILFRNIIINAAQLGKYGWLENFIENHSSELHNYHRENMKQYSLAYLHFARNEFEKSLEHISKIKYDLFLFKADMKILQLKIFYELGYYEQALSVISAAGNYLKYTKELADLFKEYVGNFMKYSRELINIKLNKNQSQTHIEYLRKRIKDTQLLSSREWIIKKSEEL